MMGVRLDWEIESDRAGVRPGRGDDEGDQQRRRALVRLLLLVLTVVVVIVGAVALLRWRLETVNAADEQQLRNTVDAEVAALRVGALDSFLTAQRSASDEWKQIQRSNFDVYQQMMLNSNVQLTGQVLSVQRDKQRARVAVQEIVDGVPYTLTWFYWLYEDGWFHVPPDYTFWGEAGQWTSAAVRVDYLAVDGAFAQTVGAKMDAWLAVVCAALTCNPAPHLQVAVMAEPDGQVRWADDNPLKLIVPSPYTGRARSDEPYDTAMQIRVANVVAEWLVDGVSNHIRPIDSADAAYLRGSAVAWLIGRIVGVDSGAYVWQSVTTQYGDVALGQVLRALQPDSTIGILAMGLNGAGLDAAGLDWRDFVAWRLQVERVLIERRDEAGFLALYDGYDSNALAVAAQRFRDGVSGAEFKVLSTAVAPDALGVPILNATLQVGDTAAAVAFRLVDTLWKRAN